MLSIRAVPRTAAVLAAIIGLVVAGVVTFDVAAGDVAKAHSTGVQTPTSAPSRPTAQGSDELEQGKRCYGDNAYRCGVLIVDWELGVVYGRASVSLGYSGDWVAVNNVRLQRAPSTSGPWKTVKTEGDYDGWRWPRDEAETPWVSPYGPIYYYRVLYHWQWTDGSGFAEGTNSSKAVLVQ